MANQLKPHPEDPETRLVRIDDMLAKETLRLYRKTEFHSSIPLGYAYYGVTGNGRMLNNFRHEVRRAWRKWLDRHNRERKMTWEKFGRLEKRFPLPLPKIYHSGST